ncbi:hypothetical protein L6452_20073 [Arctium lappa]|uniref:Uncharacterized protein n=1 Tax=Arctium lappa TaxID=4217 RepID=A0ACB9B9W2_ARCLA|nr:hypothetical protein L6452_20073 [Arctium lappa]
MALHVTASVTDTAAASASAITKCLTKCPHGFCNDFPENYKPPSGFYFEVNDDSLIVQVADFGLAKITFDVATHVLTPCDGDFREYLLL